MPRKYELKARAERQRETRLRIVEAAVVLHRRLGPARTHLVDVAKLAGVERTTVYRHFPTEGDLLRACALHNAALNPLPDPEEWRQITPPGRRLRIALEAVYTYYRHNDEIMASVLRDSEVMATGMTFLRFQATAREVLSAGWRARGARRRNLLAVVAMAVDFSTWRLLSYQQGMDDDSVRKLMLDLVQGFAPPGELG